jgi:hypothetical protein
VATRLVSTPGVRDEGQQPVDPELVDRLFEALWIGCHRLTIDCRTSAVEA